jgi:hypothetical protein
MPRLPEAGVAWAECTKPAKLHALGLRHLGRARTPYGELRSIWACRNSSTAQGLWTMAREV